MEPKVTREEFEAINPREFRGYLTLPCGPEYGCDYDECEGWCSIKDDPAEFKVGGEPFSLRAYTAEQIAEAREFRDRNLIAT